MAKKGKVKDADDASRRSLQAASKKERMAAKKKVKVEEEEIMLREKLANRIQETFERSLASIGTVADEGKREYSVYLGFVSDEARIIQKEVYTLLRNKKFSVNFRQGLPPGAGRDDGVTESYLYLDVTW